MDYDLKALMEIQPLINMFRDLSIELDYSLSPRAKTLLTIIENRGYSYSKIEIGEISAIFNCSKSDAKKLLNELIENEAILVGKDKDGDLIFTIDNAFLSEKSGEVEAVKARLSAYYERMDRKNR